MSSSCVWSEGAFDTRCHRRICNSSASSSAFMRRINSTAFSVRRGDLLQTLIWTDRSKPTNSGRVELVLDVVIQCLHRRHLDVFHILWQVVNNFEAKCRCRLAFSGTSFGSLNPPKQARLGEIRSLLFLTSVSSVWQVIEVFGKIVSVARTYWLDAAASCQRGLPGQ